MKTAIIGLGAASRHIHLPALKNHPDFKLVGGHDPQASGKFAFPLFPSADALIEATAPDMVIVATPTASHFELIQLALSANCHVLVEKPFVSTLQQADQVIALAKAQQRQVVVNNQYRFMNIHAAAQRQIGAAGFGELQFISASQTFLVSAQTEAGWRGQDPQRTCKEFGIHVLDLCRFFFAEDPGAISARMPRGRHPRGPDYLNLIELEFSGDRVAQITLDRLSRGPHRYLDIRLDGTDAIVETSIGGRLSLSFGIHPQDRRPFIDLDIAAGGRARRYQGQSYQTIAREPLNIFANATRVLLSEFAAALREQRTPPCGAEDNRNTLALMLAAYESADKRRAIDMAPYYAAG